MKDDNELEQEVNLMWKQFSESTSPNAHVNILLDKQIDLLNDIMAAKDQLLFLRALRDKMRELQKMKRIMKKLTL